MKRPPYPSDVTDDEWELIEPLITMHKGLGHPRTVKIREIVNAICYWADNGIEWRGMPMICHLGRQFMTTFAFGLDQQIEECLSKFESKTELPLPEAKKKKRSSSSKAVFDLKSHLYRITGVDFTTIHRWFRCFNSSNHYR